MIFETLFAAPLSLITYSLLLLSIVTLWVHQSVKLWGGVLAIAIIVAFIAHRIEPIALISIAGLGLCFFVSQQNRYPVALRIALGAIGTVLAVALAAHAIPGFNNWKVLDDVVFSEISIPFTMYLNFDKPLVGLFILAFGPPLLVGKQQWAAMFKGMLPILLIGLAVVYGLSFLMGYIAWDLKYSEVFVVWALRNLLFTCVAEEALFRGFLQRHLENALSRYKWGNWVSLIAIAVLFGLVHFGGGINLVILASIAGLFYGYAYQKTKRIEASILLHFFLNTAHFLFFAYPALAPGQ